MNKVVEKAALAAAEAVEMTGTDRLQMLREPFPDHQVSKLPKESKKQREEREADRSKAVNCTVCGGWHHKQAVHLDYVGHAALTDRLLETDPLWFWEPVAFREGLPAFDNTGGLWIKLTVCGVSRLGYGHAAAKPQMDPGAREKEVIGDALRNAAMRFGAALDLWHKGDLHLEPDADDKAAGAEAAAVGVLRTYANDPEQFKQLWLTNKDGWKGVLAPESYARVVAVMQEIAAKFMAAPPPPPPKPVEDFGIPEDEIPF